MASNAVSLSQMCLHERNRLREYFIHKVGRDGWEDAYHALWLRVQKVRDEPPIEDMRALLFYLARIVVLDHGRREARKTRLHEEISKIVWGQIFVLPSDEVAIARDQLSRLVTAAKTLPEPTRTIFALNRMENLTHREIAARLGLSQTTIGKHLARALKVLGAAVGRDVADIFEMIF